MPTSMLEQLRLRRSDLRTSVLDQLDPDDLATLDSWPLTARTAQLPPAGDWRTWLLMAGRGFGKTRAGAEWVSGLAENDGCLRIAIVGASAADARAVMVESGLLRVRQGGARPWWQPSLGLLCWPSGARAAVYSAESPERLRGPEHHFAWCDEIAKWPNAEATWDNLMLSLRRGEQPRVLATTTPRPVALLRRLLAEPGTVTTRGRTQDNPHLPPAFVTAVCEAYGSSRLGRQELEGELIEEVEGALWTRALLDHCRIRRAGPLSRVVVAVDPPAGASATSDACGIVVAGMGEDGRGCVLADRSVQGLSPEGWARAVASAAAEFSADRVVAEVNNGGAMVEAVLRAVDARLPVKPVRAAHGKVARAEPVAALYEADRVRHAGAFPALEDELCGLMAAGGYAGPGRSPDRADALVWALHALMLGGAGQPSLRIL